MLNDEERRALEAEFWEEQVDPNAVKRRRVDSAKERHAKQWKLPAEGQAAESAENRVTFGKYSAGKGKTVAEVLAVDPNNFEHLMSWKSNVLESDTRWTRPACGAGCQRGVRLCRELVRRRSLRKRATKLQQLEASSILAGEAKDGALAVVASEGSAKRKPGKRASVPRALVLSQHCSGWRSIAHRRTTCPYKNLQGVGVPVKTLMKIAWAQIKQSAALVSRLKYTHISGRSDFSDQRPRQLTRSPLADSFLGDAF